MKVIPYYEPKAKVSDQINHSAKRREVNKLKFIFKKLLNWVYSSLAWNCPINSLRVNFHKRRGVKIGSGVMLGFRCTLDHAYPEYLTLEDNTALAGNVYLIAHSNPYKHFRGKLLSYVAPIVIKGVSKMSLPQLSYCLLDVCNKNNLSCFLLGSKQEINDEATSRLRAQYPFAIIPRGINGYFKTYQEEKNIVKKINSLKPTVLSVGISSPKKEEFINRWVDKLDVKIIINSGGMIDVFGGETKLYPKWVKDLGLAFLYRFIQEPYRLRKDTFHAFYSLFILCPKLYYYIRIKKKRDFDIIKFLIPNKREL